MTDNSVEPELARLRARVAALEELQQTHERAAREQAGRLERSHLELRDRAEQMARSEEAMRRQTRILHAVLRSMSSGVVVAHESGRFLLFNHAAERILGTGTTENPPATWPQHYGFYLPDAVTPFPADRLPLARAMRGEEVNDEVIYVRNTWRPDGLWISVTARPLCDEVGAVRGGLSVFRDISEEKRAAQRLLAQHAVTRALAESASLGEAAPRILESVCSSIGCEVGTLWKVDRHANVLRCVDVWSRPGGRYEEFENVCRQLELTPDVGLAGGVWVRREPAWCADFSQQRDYPRAASAAAHDLHAAFAFPILFAADVTGIIEFFSRQARAPDTDLLSMMSALGRQIGQFTARRRAEADLRKSEADLRRSRERFELAMRGTGDGLWDWDLETNEVYHSPRWKEMLGYTEAEIENSFDAWQKLLHPDDAARAMAGVQAYLENRTPTYEVEHRLRHKDGSYRWILSRGVALRDADGKPYRMAGSHTDMTDRKQAEQALRDSEALYQSLVETLPLNVFRKDLDGRFTFCNQKFCKTVGLPCEAIIGKTDYDFYPPALADKYRQDDRRVIEQQIVLDAVEEHHKPDGQDLYVHVLKTPVRDAAGNVVGSQAIFWDVTDRKRAEEDLRRAKEAAEQAREAAEQANCAKSIFLANMSHEIRTPMNAIIGMTELVLDTELNVEQREYLDLVKKSADSLLAVINDVLDFSKVEAGKIDLDDMAFSLRDHLVDTLYTLAPKAYQKGLELICHVAPDVPDGLCGDPVRLGQIIVNLVGNALKFTERGEVVVEVSRMEDQGSVALHFAVKDTGIGVPRDKWESIFDAFVQADGSTTRKYGGTGLGLAIARRLVDMMGGRIWIESEVGKGSTFHFTARFGQAKLPDLKPVPAEAPGVHGMSVLVVDDNATNRLILEETLHTWQMRPTLAENGPTGLALLTAAANGGEPFALALIDVHMPEMDGYMLAERIRQQPELAGTTLMLLTSGGQPGDAGRRRQLGISSYLTKPIKQADLWRAIMQALGMPISPDEPVQAAAPRRSGKDRRLRILLAEDNLVNQKLAVRLLQKRGHDVVVANNGLEVLDQLGIPAPGAITPAQDKGVRRAPLYDVVLMDVQMPELDGEQTTALIRKHEQIAGGHLPIVAMTAYAMKGDRERYLGVGMDRYISKPIRPQELFDSVEAVALGVVTPVTHPKAAESLREVAPGAVLDETVALARVGDDRELLAEMAELFLHECPQLMNDLQRAVASGDPAIVKSAAHKLKGAVDNFAAPGAFEAARRLETMGRSGDLTGMQETWCTLEKEMDRLKPALAVLAQTLVAKSV
jgi:PAS domain S-box-containing protein